MTQDKLRIIPLGGLGEIGKNMLAIQYDGDIIVIDCGLMFPDEEMLGIDLVIPDISFLVENKDKVRGIIITHAHEDHIGALPYVLPQLDVPVYCTRLAKGLISVKIKEQRIAQESRVHTLGIHGKVTLGQFRIEFFPVNHSIPDSVGVIIHTPIGTLIHTGDFKLDYTPVSGVTTDLGKLAQLGSQGVLVLMADSTYAEVPGYTPSESVVGQALENIIGNAKGRVLVTTFASLISRMQQVIDAADKYHRRVFIVGRSMAENARIAAELGYLKIPAGTLANNDELSRTPREKTVILTTGSQGEPTSGLVRIAGGGHKLIHIHPTDTVVFSASPIPGNEALVNRTVDALFKEGAQVYYGERGGAHVHGHGAQEELKLLQGLVKPRFFVPIHGEYRHLTQHAKLAQMVGVPVERTFVLEDGDVLELDKEAGKKVGKVTSGNVYVDGLSVGDVDGTVLRSRRLLSRDGIVVAIVALNKQTGKIVGRPEIVSRGFIDAEDCREMVEGARDLLVRVLDHGRTHTTEREYVENEVKSALDKYFYDQTKRRPMILPVLVQV